MKLPLPVSSELYRPAGRFQHRLLCDHVLRCVLGEDPASLFGVRTVEPDDDGEGEPCPLYGRQQPPRHLVAAGYAAEDVEEHAPDLFVGGDDIEGGRDLLGVGPATDVAQPGYVFMPVQTGVIHRYLRVQRQDAPLPGNDERVDLDQACVETLEGFVQVQERRSYALGDVSFQPRGEGDLTHLVGEKAEE